MSRNGHTKLAPATPRSALRPMPAPGPAAAPGAQEGGTLSLADKRVLLHALERSSGFMTVDDVVPDGQARWLILESRIRAEVE